MGCQPGAMGHEPGGRKIYEWKFTTLDLQAAVVVANINDISKKI